LARKERKLDGLVEGSLITLTTADRCVLVAG